MNRRERLGIIGITLGAAAGLLGGLNTVGQQASLPGVLSLFFGGMAAGAGLVAALRKTSRGRIRQGSESGEAE